MNSLQLPNRIYLLPSLTHPTPGNTNTLCTLNSKSSSFLGSHRCISCSHLSPGLGCLQHCPSSIHCLSIITLLCCFKCSLRFSHRHSTTLGFQLLLQCCRVALSQ